MYLWTLQSKFEINQPEFFYSISLKKNKKKLHLIQGHIDSDTAVRQFLNVISVTVVYSVWVYILLGCMQYSTMNFLRKATPEHVQETPIFPAVGLGNNRFYGLLLEKNEGMNSVLLPALI